MNKEALAELFYREVEKVDRSETLDEAGRVETLYRLLHLLISEATRSEKLQFSTMFARVAYACHKYRLDKRLQFYIHHFRRMAREIGAGKETEPAAYSLGLKVLTETIIALFGKVPPAELAGRVPIQWPYAFSPVEIRSFKKKARVLALSDDPDGKQLIVRDEDNPEEEIRVQYHIAERNANFNPTIEILRKVTGFPALLNLIDVEVDVDGVYRPRAFVLEPDYLIDVSAVAECFQGASAEPWLYLLKKYLPFEPGMNLMIGNIANFFLDELMSRPDSAFQEIFPKVFQINPLAFCLFDNRQMKEIMQTSQRHFVNLKKVILQEFAQIGIRAEECFLEPSFFSEQYGLQGRLDVFFKGEEKSIIVELKSGKPFMANIHGISPNHFIQTLLYDLLIRSAFGPSVDPGSYILYSGVEDQLLRFAPAVKAQQMEAIQVRNQLFAIERLLAGLGRSSEKDLLEQGRAIFGRLRPDNFPELKGFSRNDLAGFQQVYQAMSSREKKYFVAFSGFIAREHQLAKTGAQGIESVNGLASLWLAGVPEKQENFEILSHLALRENKAREEEPLMVFSKTEHTNQLANFRNGDIAVLYPHDGGAASVLSNQIFKCTIIDITPDEVLVRLRSRQFNDSLFRQYEFWNLEHDMLDSGFTAMYRGLFEFAQSPPEKKDLLLGIIPPRVADLPELDAPSELTIEQQEIFRKALAAEDYFLLWGPPGTGKTSMMLKHLVGFLMEHTDENLLLLAYTNRAVDEICEAIEQIGPEIEKNYLRIGSRYSTASRFQPRLLQTMIENIGSRQELKELIDGHRIIVATVASISGKPELMKLKHFDRVIIDEASQILEPLLVGLLPQFQRFILIGDHKQLPAVVAQDPQSSAVEDADLQGIGLNNLRNSLFERLYKQCMAKGWDWAYAQLSHQGRMHESIMAFPNLYFYDGTLRILPETLGPNLRQKEPIAWKTNGESNELDRLLASERVLFLATPSDEEGGVQKTNIHEARMVGELVEAFQRIYRENGRAMTLSSIGIITPYRAQIAQIRSELEARNVDLEHLTIDTVERYQGGARDIILISLCTNSLSQLTSLVSLSDEGVDRKLNVALTRAREHLVILGNPDLLRSNPIYRKLIRFCQGEGRD